MAWNNGEDEDSLYICSFDLDSDSLRSDSLISSQTSVPSTLISSQFFPQSCHEGPQETALQRVLLVSQNSTVWCCENQLHRSARLGKIEKTPQKPLLMERCEQSRKIPERTGNREIYLTSSESEPTSKHHFSNVNLSYLESSKITFSSKSDGRKQVFTRTEPFAPIVHEEKNYNLGKKSFIDIQFSLDTETSEANEKLKFKPSGAWFSSKSCDNLSMETREKKERLMAKNMDAQSELTLSAKDKKCGESIPHQSHVKTDNFLSRFAMGDLQDYQGKSALKGKIVEMKLEQQHKPERDDNTLDRVSDIQRDTSSSSRNSPWSENCSKELSFINESDKEKSGPVDGGKKSILDENNVRSYALIDVTDDSIALVPELPMDLTQIQEPSTDGIKNLYGHVRTESVVLTNGQFSKLTEEAVELGNEERNGIAANSRNTAKFKLNNPGRRERKTRSCLNNRKISSLSLEKSIQTGDLDRCLEECETISDSYHSSSKLLESISETFDFEDSRRSSQPNLATVLEIPTIEEFLSVETHKNDDLTYSLKDVGLTDNPSRIGERVIQKTDISKCIIYIPEDEKQVMCSIAPKHTVKMKVTPELRTNEFLLNHALKKASALSGDPNTYAKVLTESHLDVHKITKEKMDIRMTEVIRMIPITKPTPILRSHNAQRQFHHVEMHREMYGVNTISFMANSKTASKAKSLVSNSNAQMVVSSTYAEKPFKTMKYLEELTRSTLHPCNKSRLKQSTSNPLFYSEKRFPVTTALHRFKLKSRTSSGFFKTVSGVQFEPEKIVEPLEVLSRSDLGSLQTCTSNDEFESLGESSSGIIMPQKRTRKADSSASSSRNVTYALSGNENRFDLLIVDAISSISRHSKNTNGNAFYERKTVNGCMSAKKVAKIWRKKYGFDA